MTLIGLPGDTVRANPLRVDALKPTKGEKELNPNSWKKADGIDPSLRIGERETVEFGIRLANWIKL